MCGSPAASRTSSTEGAKRSPWPRSSSCCMPIRPSARSRSWRCLTSAWASELARSWSCATARSLTSARWSPTSTRSGSPRPTGPSGSSRSPLCRVPPRARSRSSSCGNSRASSPASARRWREHGLSRAMTTTAVADEVFDEAEFAELKEEVAAYVRADGERWAELIERERSVPMSLWDELRTRGYLRLAAPRAYGGRGIPFSRSRELLELFSMSHASLRMIVHVCNGVWRPMVSHASEEQRQRFVVPQVRGEIKVAFTLTEPTAGTGADIHSSVVREGDTYYLSGEKHLITFGTVADYLLCFARLEGTSGAAGPVALMQPPRGEGVKAHVTPESLGDSGP